MAESALRIPLDVLRNVKTIVIHAHCPDGLASAILLHDVLPEAKVIFATHDQLASLPATEGMLFCDIAPPAERVAEFVHHQTVVLDHHKTAQPVVEIFVERSLGVYADNESEPGVSGAVLAFREVWRPLTYELDAQRTLEANYLSTLVGVRDTFHKTSEYWEDAWDLSAALMFRDAEGWLEEPYPFRPHFWAEQLKFGALINANNRMRADRALNEAFRFLTPAKKSVVVVQGLDLTTLLGDMGAADLVVGFAYRVDVATNQPRFQVSMRSQGVVDVASIAKAYGGGGHTNAAGFTFPCLPVLDPITTIKQILEKMGV